MGEGTGGVERKDDLFIWRRTRSEEDLEESRRMKRVVQRSEEESE